MNFFQWIGRQLNIKRNAAKIVARVKAADVPRLIESTVNSTLGGAVVGATNAFSNGQPVTLASLKVGAITGAGAAFFNFIKPPEKRPYPNPAGDTSAGQPILPQ